MIWVILTFVFSWFLCSALAIRMVEKYSREVETNQWLFYAIGPFALIISWIMLWPERIWGFGKVFSKGIANAWQQALKAR